MKYAEALTALIDQRYADAIRIHENVPSFDMPTRDEVATGRENVRIAAEVFGNIVNDAFYKKDGVSFGTFDNCREYGMTATIGDWTFCAYEHRNSDEICIEGCPTADIKPYGPYGGADKYDVMFSAHWKQYHEAVEALVAAMKAVKETPGLKRNALKAIIKDAQVSTW